MSGLPYLVIRKKKGLADGTVEEAHEFPGHFVGNVHRNFIKPIRSAIQDMSDDIKRNFPDSLEQEVDCVGKFTMSGEVSSCVHHQFYWGDFMLTKYDHDVIQRILKDCPKINDSENLTEAWIVPTSDIKECSHNVQLLFSKLNYSHFYGFDVKEGYRILKDVYDVLDNFKECIIMTGFTLCVSITDKSSRSIVWRCDHSFITDETISRGGDQPWESHIGSKIQRHAHHGDALIALREASL